MKLNLVHNTCFFCCYHFSAANLFLVSVTVCSIMYGKTQVSFGSQVRIGIRRISDMYRTFYVMIRHSAMYEREKTYLREDLHPSVFPKLYRFGPVGVSDNK